MEKCIDEDVVVSELVHVGPMLDPAAVLICIVVLTRLEWVQLKCAGDCIGLCPNPTSSGSSHMQLH